MAEQEEDRAILEVGYPEGEVFLDLIYEGIGSKERIGLRLDKDMVELFKLLGIQKLTPTIQKSDPKFKILIQWLKENGFLKK